MKETTRDRKVNVGEGLTLHVNDVGTGPPLVLLHGFTGTSEMWAPLVPALSAEYRMITVDLPGHGQSSAPADYSRYSLKSFARDLARMLDTLGIERTALMGYSMGGRAALRFALDCHDRLAALILESTSPGIADPGLRRLRIASDRALADRIEHHGMESFVDEWERLLLWETQRSLPDAVRDALRKQRLSNTKNGLANSLRGAGAGLDEPVHGRLGDIHAPALAIAGALDNQYVIFAEEFATSMPNARAFIVPDAGHAVHLERPNDLADATVRFLRSVPSAEGRWLSA